MKTLQQILPTFSPEFLDRYDFSGAAYTGALVRITGIVCPDHGVFSQYSAQLRKIGGAGCPACGDVLRKASQTTPAEAYVAKVTALHSGKYDYSGTLFTKMNARIKVVCGEHGLYSITANHHYYRKQGCPACEGMHKKTRILEYRHLSAQAKIQNTAVDFFERCATKHADLYTYPPQTYAGAKEKIQIVCKAHGTFLQDAWPHLNGSGCPKCGAYDAKWERALEEYLLSLGETNVVRNAAILGKQHIDVYLPDRRIGVELHGLHWHTDAKRGATYHRGKWEAAGAAGIRLIQVFEDEWVNKQDIVKARLSALLGQGQRFDARKCEMRVCEAQEARTFLDKTHVQGGGLASMYYGLYFQQVLVAVASFGRSRSGAMTGAMREGVWEVIRYASTGRVRGGFSRLLKAFVAAVHPTEIVSYCDLRYGDGKLYQATGFVLDSVTEPDYWWVPAGKVVRIPRYATQKHKLSTHPVLGAFYAPGKTELQICAEAGWEKIHGVGHQKWLWVAP